MTTDHDAAEWLQAIVDQRVAEIRNQPPTPAEITRRNGEIFAAQLDAVTAAETTTNQED